MDMSQIEELVLTGVDNSTPGMRYAQGFGRLVGFLWGTIERMNPEDQANTRRRLEEFAQWWAEKEKKVEESTT